MTDQHRCRSVPDIDAALARIDEMAYRVDAEIRRNYHRFVNDPSEGDNSQAKYSVLMMVTVLQQDFGVQYNPERIRNPDFRDASDLFIHGMLGGNGGTCASMPVLYTAVGRRLGWPLKLVHTHAHVFCRWDDPDGRHPCGKEYFNLEGTGHGANLVSDDYYHKWPEPLTDEMIERFGYLRSLTPAEELAGFLMLRGHCLEDNGWIGKAMEAYGWSCRLSPSNLIYQAFRKHAEVVHDRILEKQTLQDYYGSDVPLPFGYFPRHVLRQMAAEMAFADCEHFNRTQRLEREQFEARFQSQIQRGRSQLGPAAYQLPDTPTKNPNWPPATGKFHAGFGTTGLSTPPGIASIPGVPFPHRLTGVSSAFPLASASGFDFLSAKTLRAVDPQRLAMRRQEVVAITKSLPDGAVIRQPGRPLLAPPKTFQSIQPSNSQET